MLKLATWSAVLPSWPSTRLLIIVGVLLPIKVATLWHALHRPKPRTGLGYDYVHMTPGPAGAVLTAKSDGKLTWAASKTTVDLLYASGTTTLATKTLTGTITIGPSAVPVYDTIEISDAYTCKREGKRTLCRRR
jgi:hypothetical protein